jgi:16S rRNA (guanine966-N2)-methyltransferase
MRITGGTAGRRRLKVPAGYGVRPTPDRVKQAIFNSLGRRVIGARVLELFAGSGALSLECLSRGAVAVVCVERSARHAALIRLNLTASGLPPERIELRTQDAFAVIRQLADALDQFDLILADPPFGEKNLGRRSESLSQQLLDEPCLPQLLAPNGLFVLGHASRDTLTFGPPWAEAKTIRHGDSVIAC